MSSARIALLAVLVLGALGLGASCNRNNTSGSSAAAGSTGDSHPTAAGGPEVNSVPGVDVAELSQAETGLFWAIANDELSPCGDPHSLAVCGRDHTCNLCVPALHFLERRVKEGFPREELGDLVRARFARSAVQTVHIDGAPTRGGGAGAPVTLVEFADYECPHCGRAAPVLEGLEREFGDRLRVVQMQFPLSGHVHALQAAKAATAAGRQGKFWEFHDLLFRNQTALEPADLDRYATQVGLDMNRFHADEASPDIEAAVTASRREGERLQIQGTPTFFINGRQYPEHMPVEATQLREWIQEEIDLPH